MKSKSFDAQGLQFAWNASSITLAETCLRKYFYGMIEGWQSAQQSVHLTFGSAYATALEHYFQHKANGDDHDEALVKIVHEALANTWEREWALEDGSTVWAVHEPEHAEHTGPGRPQEFLHNAKTRENLIRTIVWYFEHFADDPAQIVILSDGQPAVEHTFALPVDNDILFTGHIDRLVNYSGDVYVMDQKSTGSTISPAYFRQWDVDVQMSMYTFAGKMIYNLPVRGVIIDGAQIAVGFSRFERGFAFRTEEILSEWYDVSLHTIETARHATRENYFPMNRTACNNYGGCPFREVCSKNPSMREQFLKASFVKGKALDPLDHR